MRGAISNSNEKVVGEQSLTAAVYFGHDSGGGTWRHTQSQGLPEALKMSAVAGFFYSTSAGQSLAQPGAGRHPASN